MDCISKQLQLFLVGLLLAFPLPLFAAAGKVVIAAGDVFAVNAQDERRPLQRRSDIFEGDTLVTGADGSLQLRFEDNAILALRADSQLRISEYHGATDSQPERVLMDLLGGGFRTISGSFGKSERDAYQVRTPNASIGIRGTHYEAVFQSDTLTVGVYEGGIVLTNDQGSLNLGLDSEFVFAQVQAGNLPQGLLNPPANLNVPNTPRTNESGEETEEEGTDDSDSETTDESATQSPDSTVNSTATNETSSSGFTADDFNFSALEDALNTLGEATIGTVKLSKDETTALQDPQVTTVGILVMAPSETGSNGQPMSDIGPMIAYSSSYTLNNQLEDYPAFFVAYEDQTVNNDLTEAPNFVLRPNSDYPYYGPNEGNPNNFLWGLWDYDGQTVGSADAGINTSFGSGTVDQPFFFVEAEPTQATLSGTMNFELISLVVANGYWEGQSGFMEVEFGSGNASGQFGFGGYTDDQEILDWFIYFEGQVSGTVLDASLTGESSISISGNDTSPLSLEGGVAGIFTGGSEEEGLISFIGGFTAESSNGQYEDYGVFIMEETPIVGDNPQENF